MVSLDDDNECSKAVDINTGTCGVIGLPDIGFPQTGVLTEGALNLPGWAYAELDLNSTQSPVFAQTLKCLTESVGANRTPESIQSHYHAFR